MGWFCGHFQIEASSRFHLISYQLKGKKRSIVSAGRTWYGADLLREAVECGRRRQVAYLLV
jgi:hypothetical protein